jgi:hypothetical protein
MTESFLRKQGDPFVIYRDGERAGEAVGVKSEQEHRITFVRGVELFVGDWLEDPNTEARYRVTDVHDASLPSKPRRSNISVSYETAIEYERREAATRVIALLDDIAKAIETLNDTQAPPKQRRAAEKAINELKHFIRGLPPGVATELGFRIFGS